jgi:hypothetical protein
VISQKCFSFAVDSEFDGRREWGGGGWGGEADDAMNCN